MKYLHGLKASAWICAGLAGCGSPNPAPNLAPPTQSARAAASDSATGATCPGADVTEILVGDGYLTILCGCVGAGEGAGTTSSPGSSLPQLTCHLPTSTTQVVFNFGPGPRILPHQIISVGSPAFNATAIVPVMKPGMIAYPIVLTQSGVTYQFQDVYTGASGKFIVP